MKKVIARIILWSATVIVGLCLIGLVIGMPIYYIVTDGEWGPAFVFGGVALFVGFIAAVLWANEVLEGNR